MPRVSDYRLADCRLYRTPVVDMSCVEKLIEESLLKAWERGVDANKALEKILRDESILGPLAGQIKDSVGFQKGSYMASLEDEMEALRREAEEEYRGKLKSADSSLGKTADEKNRIAREAQEEYERKRSGYSVVSRRLEEMRERVQQRAGKIGGESGFSELMEIYRLVEQQSGQGGDGLSDEVSSKEDLYKGAFEVVGSKKYDPLSEFESREKKYGAGGVDGGGSGERWYKRAWRILNTDIKEFF